jgi:hypothetical protein
MNDLDFQDFVAGERQRLTRELVDATGMQCWFAPDLPLKELKALVYGEIAYLRRCKRLTKYAD